MFDDPKNTLRRMEEELRAAEYEEEAEEPDGEFDYADDSWLEDAKALIGEDEEIPIRNHANGYGTRPRNYAMYEEYDEEELDEDAVLYAQEPQKKKGIGGLVLLALLEVLGILVVLWWWARWLL
ncbi:MAG: hypothetical protein ACI4PH_08355 [Faecousia sp.]